MKNWDDLRYLVAVHKTGSMSAAARLLETNPATVSRRLSRLSESLGFDLFVKTPEGWVANEAISDLIETITGFENEIVSYLHTQSTAAPATGGNITVGCPPTISSYVFYPALRAFLESHPGLRMTFNALTLTEALGENDMIIVTQRPEQGRLVVRYIGKFHINVYAYPDSPRDMGWIGLNRSHDQAETMQFARKVMAGHDPLVRVETLHEIMGAMRSSRLPGLLPNIVAMSDPELQRFEPEQADLVSPLYLCFHETRRRDPLLQDVADWIAQEFNHTTQL
ncbi:LysR family transcriptional regulator [Pseudooceanicola nanhaiensis]|uniref:LysR family transcriptional regulator n=1 Tax=Pseudooceanicola nanhaiensis TaxID=375761 RepID=UPI001CD77ED1|nr:LysR family transcriptional regulator [Pseudooceanicola nanhaiensis]MCA0919862.1 LysR family transcriptional regulator [Pseudooceanicola nanhaiensis]